MNEEVTQYRWYLYVQDKADKWSCVQKTKDEVLYVQDRASRPDSFLKKATKAVPITKFCPRVLDPLILRYVLHPRVEVTW